MRRAQVRRQRRTIADHDSNVDEGGPIAGEADRESRRHRVVAPLGGALLAAAVGVLLVSVWSRPDTTSPVRPAAGPAAHPSSGLGSPQYEVTAPVLLGPGKLAEICPVVAQSLPPQCAGSGIGITNWTMVQGGADPAGGLYYLVGTYDGGRFTLTRAATPTSGPATPVQESLVRPAAGCTVPTEGRSVASTSLAQYQRLVAASQQSPDFAGMWIDQQGTAFDPTRDVETVAFTGDVAAHRATLSALWPGPLCVVVRPRSIAQLHSIADELIKDPGGLQLMSTGIDQERDAVDVVAAVMSSSDVKALDTRFGAGAVRATGWLQRVS